MADPHNFEIVSYSAQHETEVEYYWEVPLENVTKKEKDKINKSDNSNEPQLLSHDDSFHHTLSPPIHNISSSVTCKASPFTQNYTGNSYRKDHYEVTNKFDIAFDINFEFGEKNVFVEILSSLPYLQDDTNYEFLANLIEPFHKIERDIYECSLSGKFQIDGPKGGWIQWWRNYEHDWYEEGRPPPYIDINEYGEMGTVDQVCIELTLKNSYYPDRTHCAVFDIYNQEYVDYSGYKDWPLLLSVYNDKQYTPDSIASILLNMMNIYVKDKIEPEIINWYNDEKNHHLSVSGFPRESKINMRTIDSLDLDIEIVNEYSFAEWIEDMFTNQCVVSYSD